jgi:hypothetical protein
MRYRPTLLASRAECPIEVLALQHVTEHLVCAHQVEGDHPLEQQRHDGGIVERGLRCAPLGPSAGIRAGQWRRQFAGRGITLHQADCLIATATAGIDARLATGNPADFPMDDITVEHWPVGR